MMKRDAMFFGILPLTLMAQAIKRLYPEAQLGIGPPIDDGFYYDIDLDKILTPEDFDAIED